MKQLSITLGQYLPGNSFIHKLDPRTKIIVCLLLMTFTLFSREAALLLFYVFFCLLILLAARISPSLALNNLKPFILLFLLTIVLHSFLTEGASFWEYEPLGLQISREGAERGIFYTLRICVLVIIAAMLTLTTQPMALTDAVEYFLKPLRKIGIPAHEIAMMLSISLRFIPTLLEESERIKKAQISRGAAVSGNLKQKLQNMIPLLVPLFLATFRRANDLALAMDSRCYRGGQGRTSYIRLAFGKNDAWAFAAAAAVSLPLFFLQAV